MRRQMTSARGGVARSETEVEAGTTRAGMERRRGSFEVVLFVWALPGRIARTDRLGRRGRFGERTRDAEGRRSGRAGSSRGRGRSRRNFPQRKASVARGNFARGEASRRGSRGSFAAFHGVSWAPRKEARFARSQNNSSRDSRPILPDADSRRNTPRAAIARGDIAPRFAVAGRKPVDSAGESRGPPEEALDRRNAPAALLASPVRTGKEPVSRRRKRTRATLRRCANR